MDTEDISRLLQNADFGSSAAENETGTIELYFVETYQWKKFENGRTDIVFGAKGSGKSSIYQVVKNNRDKLFDKNIIIITAENAKESKAFDLFAEFDKPNVDKARKVWKLYFLSLSVRSLIDYGIKDRRMEVVLDALSGLGLLDQDITLRKLLKRVYDYVSRLTRFKSLEPTLGIDSVTGLPNSISAKVVFHEPSDEEVSSGSIFVDNLLLICDNILIDKGISIWIMIDRLDSVFSEDTELESIFIRSLFDVYKDLLTANNIRLKIFLRTDIWKSISSGKFREASHIERTDTLSWPDRAITNLLAKRFLFNTDIVEIYNLNPPEILIDYKKQEMLIDRLLSSFPKPDHVVGNITSQLIYYLQDGFGFTSPRDIIQFLNFSKDAEIESLLRGESPDESNAIFTKKSIIEALEKVSKTKLDQTVYSEYPDIRPYFELLGNSGPSNFSLEELSAIWTTDRDITQNIALRMIHIGLLRYLDHKGRDVSLSVKNDKYRYRIPVSYRLGLGKKVQNISYDT